MLDVKIPAVYRLTYAIGRVICRRLAKKYGFETDGIPDMGEPYIMVCNHVTESDQIFVMLASTQPVYFVCGEHLLRNPVYGRPLKLLADPIPVEKQVLLKRREGDDAPSPGGPQRHDLP